MKCDMNLTHVFRLSALTPAEIALVKSTAK